MFVEAVLILVLYAFAWMAGIATEANQKTGWFVFTFLSVVVGIAIIFN